MKNIKAVIFDLDGTLIDTEGLYYQTWRQAVAEAGFTMTYEQYLSLRSLGRPYIQRRLAQWYGNEFDLPAVRTVRNRLFSEHIEKNGLRCKPGAIEILQFLRSRGITTAVATATDMPRATAYLTMTGLLPYLDQVISAKMVEVGKPAPDVYRFACETLGLLPEECLAVEDAPNGVISAFTAGCQVVMVPDLSEPDGTIAPMLSACIRGLEELIPILS